MRNSLSVFLLGLVALLPAAAQEKRRVAVMDFGYATVMNQVQAIFGTNQDIGKGITDLVIDQLVNDGTYRVIERSALDKITKEQNFSNTDRVNASSAAKIGALLGADTIVIGDITAFGGEDKNYNAGGGGGTGWWNKGGAGGLGIKKSKIIVEITARLVDVNTGEILASVTGHGEVQKSGLGVGGGGHDGWTGGGGQFSMGSSNFQQSAIGQATKQSVTQLATNLDQKSATLPVVAAAPLAPIDGLVADASTADIVINVGTKAGVKVGDTLAVTRVTRTVKDPATGKVLRTLDSPVGTLAVTSVDADSAVGKFSGTGAPKIGDRVKRPD
jgi:curli biogenesis system outer membrane secretion channel CsgG